MKHIVRIMVMLLGFTVASQALAFDLERSAVPAPTAEQPKAVVVSPGAAVNKRESGGRMLRIPGLGSIGVLPKLDFGLELLYGTSKERASSTDGPKADPEVGSFRIRGSIKHSF